VPPARLGLGVASDVPGGSIVLFAVVVGRRNATVGLFPSSCSGRLGFGIALVDFVTKSIFVSFVGGVGRGDLLCDGRRSERGQSDSADDVAEIHYGLVRFLGVWKVSVWAVLTARDKKGQEEQGTIVGEYAYLSSYQ
jgi:hypothetical protein